MKCVCGAKMAKIKTGMDFFGGRVIVRDAKAFYCPQCREELFDSKEGNRISLLSEKALSKVWNNKEDNIWAKYL